MSKNVQKCTVSIKFDRFEYSRRLCNWWVFLGEFWHFIESFRDFLNWQEERWCWIFQLSTKRRKNSSRRIAFFEFLHTWIIDRRTLRWWIAAVGVVEHNRRHRCRCYEWMVSWWLWRCTISRLWLSKPIAKSSLVAIRRCRRHWIVVDDDLRRMLAIFRKFTWLFWQCVEIWMILCRRIVVRLLRLNVNASLVVLLTRLVRQNLLVRLTCCQLWHEKISTAKLTFSRQCVEESHLTRARTETEIEPFVARLTEHSQCILQRHSKHFAIGQIEYATIFEKDSSLVYVACAFE